MATNLCLRDINSMAMKQLKFKKCKSRNGIVMYSRWLNLWSFFEVEFIFSFGKNPELFD